MSNSYIEIKNHEFHQIAKLVYDSFGIVLLEEKKSLVINRLNKVLRQRQLKNFKSYFKQVVEDSSGEELKELGNLISTNHTFFYREPKHFDFYAKVALPEWKERLKQNRDHDLRVWCAASSSGEEPYTLAMLQQEFFGSSLHEWHAGLLASDISVKALRSAMGGIYTLEDIAPLPPVLKNKYFIKKGDGTCEIAPETRRLVTYRRINLMHQLNFKKPMHMIFCRNVMIYFDNPTKEELVKRLFRSLAPGGYLFIGHSESIPRNGDWEYVQPAIYRKPLS